MRGPKKFDIDQLVKYSDFTDFVRQVSIVTATSHARGTVGKSPAQFKEIVSSVLGPASAKATWSVAVSLIAAAYHEQVVGQWTFFDEEKIITERGQWRRTTYAPRPGPGTSSHTRPARSPARRGRPPAPVLVD